MVVADHMERRWHLVMGGSVSGIALDTDDNEETLSE